MTTTSEIRTGAAHLPVLHSVDVAVMGGSCAGVAAAVTCARAGLSTLVVEPRTYLGREITATLRPWITLHGEAQERFWHGLLRRMGIQCRVGEEIPLKMDDLKLALEDLCLEGGVHLLYASRPVDVIAGCEGIAGVIIGNKSGRQAIHARSVVDASETALLARLVGASFTPLSGRQRYGRTLEFDDLRGDPGATLAVPPELGIADHRVHVYRGYRGERHALVELALDLPFADGPAACMAREITARHVSMALARHLVREEPAFREATFASSSPELAGPQTAPLAAASQAKSLPDGLAGPLPGMWTLNEGASIATMDRPVQAIRIGEAVGEAIAAGSRMPSGLGWPIVAGVGFSSDLDRPMPGEATHSAEPTERLHARTRGSVEATCARPLLPPEPAGASHTRPPGAPWSPVATTSPPSAEPPLTAGHAPGSCTGSEQTSGSLTLGEPEGPQRGRAYERHRVEDRSFPLLGHCDVLVVGGGTSGASAAITAAREGANTILLEMNPGLGGTGTLAGVHSYWYGRHVAFAAAVQGMTDEVHRDLGHTKSTWNIEAKMYALLRAAEGAGARVFFNTWAIGALLDGATVRGALVSTPWGPYAVLADVVIDATGDGDVAAFAGARFVYGAETDHTTMWYSLGQFTRPGLTRNNFTSSVDVSNIQDYTRAILAGRRRGNAVHDHSIYVAPRESRHIEGAVTMTHTDQLLKRQWPDTVNIHYSNHDVKGCSTSPWVRVGLIPPNLEIEVPYRALLPRDLQGILVTGKAISATHDALPAIRMQADMETLGGVAALAACQSLRERVPPHAIDVTALQRRLIDEGVLPPSVVCRDVAPSARDTKALRRLVDALTGDVPLYGYSDMEMGEIFEGSIPFVEVCTAGPEIVPVLEAALPGAAGLRRQHLAQALAMYGCASAVPVLLACIDAHLRGDGLPARDNQIRHANYPPDQGAMPDVVYLLYSLGMTRDPRALPVWERVVDLIDGTADDVRDRRQGTFYYVEAICWGAAELGDERAVPLLERLHTRPALHGNLCLSGFQPDHFLERQAMMELMIGRALARCGSAHGVDILIAYLEDSRALLAEQAHSHLQDITGQDFGKDAQAWQAWRRAA